MKKRSLAITIILLCILMLVSCSKYEITPGEQADFKKMPDGSKALAEEIVGEIDDKNVIQQPAAYFLRDAWTTGPEGQSVKYITSSEAESYMALLTDVFGFEMFYENLGYVYNTWYFVHPDSNKETGNYGSGYDVMVRHYYDSSTTTTKYWIDVSIDDELFSFGDFGYRYNESLTRDSINGKYARDAFVIKKGKYYNFSDGKLSVKSGVKKETLYTYTKPFASEFYGFYGYDGLCTLMINGGKPQTYDALISDYEDFDSSSTDMIFVSKSDGSRLVNITWEHESFEVGKVYDLADFAASSYNKFDFTYDEHEFTESSAICLTVRPLWLDREGKTESVVYFYGEFRDSEGEIYTVEGLLAAPFCLEETSEIYDSSSSSSSSGGNSWNIFDDDDDDGPFIPEFAKLDCLTCGGDGDCNTCNGYGDVERYAGAGDYVTAKCTSCYGSGNCRTCGGSGKRD